MSDVFISYAHATTAQKARAAAEALRSAGYSVWIDDDLPVHRAFSREIDAQLSAAKAALVFWSADAAMSDWVLSEADRARLEHKIVQIRLDGVRLPMPFDQIQCADLTDWTGDTAHPAWARVVNSVSELVGRPPAPSLTSAPTLTSQLAGAREGPSPASLAHSAVVALPLLAVLPFDNLSDDAELLYFSDGLSEEILQTVARTTRLNVIGRSSSFQFRGASKAAHRVADELGCTHILDGSVRRSGGRIRVAANLIECERQTMLWSDRFDRDLADVFALQDEIAGAVAEALNQAFAPSEDVGPIDPEAYELYLRARAKTLEAVVGAEAADWMAPADVDLLEEALRRAPRFAQGWSELALAKAVLAQSQHTVLAFEKAANGSRTAARTALGLNGNVGAALTAESLLMPLCGRYADRERLLSKARAASPGDEFVLFQSGVFAARVGRARDALDFAAEAYRLNPLNPHAAFWLANSLFTVGRQSEALALWEEGRVRWPEHPGMTSVAMYYAAVAGDWHRADALATVVRALPNDFLARGTPEANLAAIEMLKHRPPEALEALIRGGRSQIQQSGTIQFQFVGFISHMGFTDAAYELIEAASFTHLHTAGHPATAASGSPHTLFDSQNADLRADPRFVALCARLGLPRYWVASGRWPDCADAGVLPYDFKSACRQAAAA